MIAALIDVTMDRMEKEISGEFQNIDNAVRTALAFDNHAQQSATLALLNRYATRHARDYHRALKQLREEQSCGAGHRRPRTAVGSQAAKTPVTAHTTTGPQPATRDEPQPTNDPLATPTGHRPLAAGHCRSERVV
jgi:hypothetical protein